MSGEIDTQEYLFRVEDWEQKVAVDFFGFDFYEDLASLPEIEPRAMSTDEKVMSFVNDGVAAHKPLVETEQEKSSVRKALAALASDSLAKDVERSARFRELQISINPELSGTEIYSAEKTRVKADTNVAARALIQLVEEARADREEWSDQRKCKDQPLDFFFPTTTDSKKHDKIDRIKQAMAFCQDCPVIEQCDAYGAKYNEKQVGGARIYGGKAYGLDAREKRALRNHQKPANE